MKENERDMMSDYSKADIFQGRWSEMAGFVPGLKDKPSSFWGAEQVAQEAGMDFVLTYVMLM